MTEKLRRTTQWPKELASIGAIRFARRSSNFQEAVRFYCEVVGLPLYETFEASYGSNGAIFGLPGSALTMEIVEAVDAHACNEKGFNRLSSTRTGKRPERSPIGTRTAAKSCSHPSCSA